MRRVSSSSSSGRPGHQRVELAPGGADLAVGQRALHRGAQRPGGEHRVLGRQCELFSFPIAEGRQRTDPQHEQQSTETCDEHFGADGEVAQTHVHALP